MYDTWKQTYEKLTDCIVPRSTRQLHEDEEYGLYTVTLFRKVVDEFKHIAREKRYAFIPFQRTPSQFLCFLKKC